MADFGSRRMARGPSGPRAIRNVSDACSVIRNLGEVASLMHQFVMRDLVAAGRQSDAEQFNDACKPLVDMLRNFSIEGSSDGPPPVPEI